MKWSPQRGSGSGTCSSSLSPDHAAFPAQCGLSRCRVRVSADLLRGGSGGPRPTTASTAAEPTFWNQMNSFRYCFVNQPILVCETLLRKPDTRPVYEMIQFANFANWNRSVYINIYNSLFLFISCSDCFPSKHFNNLGNKLLIKGYTFEKIKGTSFKIFL